MASVNMFSAAIATRSSTPTSYVRSRLDNPVIYYIPAGGMTREKVMDLSLACIAACTNDNAPLDMWKNLIATYTNLLFEGILSKLPKASFQAVTLSDNEMAALHQKFTGLVAASDAADENSGLPAGAFADYRPSWNLPAPSVTAVGEWGVYSREEKTIAAHYALVVFLAGKQINDQNRTAITEARPRALIEKFKIECITALNGSMRMSNYAHIQINQAWLEMSSLKAECFREFSTYTHMQTSLSQDILLTNVNLMRFSQMQHAMLIHKFLLAYPWAIEMPQLRQSVSIYKDGLESASKIESHLQPFIKVIWGDKSGLFQRKDLGPLIACALETEREINETLSQYYSDERFASVVEAFRDERAKRMAGKSSRVTAGSVVVAAPETPLEGEEDEDDAVMDEGDEL